MRLAALLAASVLAACAQAQEISLDASAAVKCLAPAAAQRGVPEYPFEAFKAGMGGSVTVRLTFDASDAGPEVEVLEKVGDDAFVDAVKQHVRVLRVPCLDRAQSPVRLLQQYVFKPDQRQVYWSRAQDLADTARREMFNCLTHRSGHLAPDYPELALRDEIQGRVLSRLVFEAADRPPKATLYSRRYARPLARHVERWVDGLRLPCFAGPPASAQLTWLFKFAGERTYGFRDVTLRGLLASVKGIEHQTLAFDFNTMNCPFDLRVRYLQPYLPNGVGEVGDRNPVRREFLDWLSGIELKLPDETIDAVFADTFTLTVPCLKIDLKPKEKS